MNNKILVVDDSEAFIDLLVYTLNDAGYDNITVALNGRDGFKHAYEQTFDLIITDIDMPKMNGYSMIKNIKNLSQYKKKPILVLSVVPDIDSKQKARDVGALGWITKPYLPRELIKAIEVCLSRS
jgi:two-component system chemotaxis response regulator CheY